MPVETIPPYRNRSFSHVGTSPEYEERLQMLIEERDSTINKANLYREYQLQLSEKIFDEEVAQAEEDYEVGGFLSKYIIVSRNLKAS